MDVFPEFAPPLVEIQTEAPGLSTEEVESLVSVPLENALNGTIGLKTIRSKSVLGLSSVVLILKEGTDLMAARQVVQERLSVEAPRLPAAAKRAGDPVSAVVDQPGAQDRRDLEDSFANGPDRAGEVDDPAAADVDSRSRQRGDLGPARPAVPGDGRSRAAAANAVTLDAVVKSVTDAATPAAGGFVDTPNQRIAVRHRSPIDEPEDLARTTVAFRNTAPCAWETWPTSRSAIRRRSATR